MESRIKLSDAGIRSARLLHHGDYKPAGYLGDNSLTGSGTIVESG